MADEDDQNQEPEPEPEQRLFTLTEAERARQELEPFLLEARRRPHLLLPSAGRGIRWPEAARSPRPWAWRRPPVTPAFLRSVENERPAEWTLDFFTIGNTVPSDPSERSRVLCTASSHRVHFKHQSPAAAREFACHQKLKIVSKTPPAPTCVPLRTSPSTGMSGATPLSLAQSPKTSRCSWILARCGAIGATSSTARATRIRTSRG